MADGLIWSCPDCDNDLDPAPHGQFWCPACQQSISAARLAYWRTDS